MTYIKQEKVKQALEDGWLQAHFSAVLQDHQRYVENRIRDSHSPSMRGTIDEILQLPLGRLSLEGGIGQGCANTSLVSSVFKMLQAFATDELFILLHSHYENIDTNLAYQTEYMSSKLTERAKEEGRKSLDFAIPANDETLDNKQLDPASRLFTKETMDLTRKHGRILSGYGDVGRLTNLTPNGLSKVLKDINQVRSGRYKGNDQPKSLPPWTVSKELALNTQLPD